MDLYVHTHHLCVLHVYIHIYVSMFSLFICRWLLVLDLAYCNLGSVILQRRQACRYLFGTLICTPLVTYPAAGLLNHGGSIFGFWGSAIPFRIMAVSVYIPTHKVQRSLVLYIFANISHLSFHHSHPTRLKQQLTMLLIFTSSMSNGVMFCNLYCVGCLCALYGERSAQILCLSLNWAIVLLSSCFPTTLNGNSTTHF